MKKLKRLFLSKSPRKISYATAIGASFVALGNTVNAQIIQDNFTSGSQYGTSLGQEGTNVPVGLTPTPTNLPGGTYQHVGGPFYGSEEYTTNNQGNFAGFNNNSAAGITLGAYNTGSIAISGALEYQFGNGNGPSNPSDVTPGAAAFTTLGFTSTVNSNSNYIQGALDTFTGLEAQVNGSLQEYVDGQQVGSSVAFVGTYNPLAATTLSYDINTTTGAISDVSFGDSTAAYAFTTSGAFLNTDTAYVELGGDAQNSGMDATISSLDVQAASIPEPSTYALLAAGALALGGLGMQRRTRALRSQR